MAAVLHSLDLLVLVHIARSKSKEPILVVKAGTHPKEYLKILEIQIKDVWL